MVNRKEASLVELSPQATRRGAAWRLACVTEVNEEENSVLVRLSASSYPNRTGTTPKRFEEIPG
jgi:hypothetical protein